MAEIRLLIVDDEESWRQLLERALQPLGENVHISVAASYSTAKSLIREKSFDLAVVDLRLEEAAAPPDTVNEMGFRILQDLRTSEFSQTCGLLILTGYPTSEIARRAFKELGVYDFLEKDKFDRDQFCKTVKAALFDTLLKRTKSKREKRQLLSFTFSGDKSIFAQLRGRDRYQDCYLTQPISLKVDDLARRCDTINEFLSPPYRSEHHEKWREEARSIGTSLYDAFAQNRDANAILATGRSSVKDSTHLSLCFNGPNLYLSVPFELLNDSQHYLALMYPLYRKAFWQNAAFSNKVEPFHVFIERLQQEKRDLRILLIASNTGNRIQAVDSEIDSLKRSLESTLSLLGLRCVIEILHSNEANFSDVTRLLGQKNFHIIHYAGHGRYDDEIAERSGLCFLDGDKPKTMQADVLNSLLLNSGTYLFYLSCCLGARTSVRDDKGDFLGTMDGILQADVPAVLGYRWVVTDNDAKTFALEFYDSLFNTFSLEDAVFNARHAIVRAKGRQDETWASPVLVLQNP